MPISEPYRNIQLLGFNRARISVYVEHNNVRGGGDLLGRLGYTS